jgi:hypothetical protein
MINLFLIWLSFVLLMSFSEELDLAHFVLFSSSMFYFTSLYNKINPVVLSKKTTLLLFSATTLILWYTAFVYNDFLCLNPIPYEMFMSLFFTYFLIILYLLISLHTCKTLIS